MKYVIDGFIVFDYENTTLKNINTNDEVMLPLPAARLLHFIVISEGEILTREWLLNEVWDNFGLQGSNNNLNNYLSLIRRTLVNLECENFIETIPKVGIRLSTNAIITIDNREKKQSLSLILLGKLKSNVFFSKFAVIYFALFLSFCFSFLYFNSFIDGSFTIQKPYVYNGCNIVLFNSAKNNDSVNINNLISNNIRRLGLSCNQQNVIFFDITQKVDNKGFNRYFLSFCTKKEERLINCSTYNLQGENESVY